MNFEFKYMVEEYDFFCEIADNMVEFFNISHEEAVNRINSQWRNRDLSEYDCLVYHEMPDYWAYAIYCNDDSEWGFDDREDVIYPKLYNPQTNKYE